MPLADRRPPTPSPGPPQHMVGTRLPAPPPAGEVPPDDSRLWQFSQKAIVAGEKWVQDDTREWFEETMDRKVQVCRSYPTHPRWIVGPAAQSFKGKWVNRDIVSEVHILARLEKGLSDVPAWVPARYHLKQMHADTNYRLTRLTRSVLIEKGKQAMIDFAERGPGQFLKFVAGTFIPKKVETDVTVNAAQGMDPEVVQDLLGALTAEMDRRALEAKEITQIPDDVEVNDTKQMLLASAETLHEATGAYEKSKTIISPNAKPMSKGRRLHKVVDPEADEALPDDFWD